MYSRRSKNLCKKVLSAWQKKTRRWIVKVKKTLRRQTWRERIVSSGKKDPLVCPKCECYYEYKGEVCLEDGTLEIKVALCPITKAYLERVPSRAKKERKKETITSKPVQEKERQLCLFDVS